MRLRDGWRVARPAGFNSAGDYGYAECWDVTIREEERPGDLRFILDGVLVAQVLPRRWSRELNNWIETEAEIIPGVRVGGYRFNSLAGARERARQLVTLLGAKMFFEDVRLHKFA